MTSTLTLLTFFHVQTIDVFDETVEEDMLLNDTWEPIAPISSPHWFQQNFFRVDRSSACQVIVTKLVAFLDAVHVIDPLVEDIPNHEMIGQPALLAGI